MSFIDEIKAQMRVILTLFDEFKDDYAYVISIKFW